jgi:hypothetical protein
MMMTLVAQTLDVESPVFVNQENVLTIVAPLGDVVRSALDDHRGPFSASEGVVTMTQFGACH